MPEFGPYELEGEIGRGAMAVVYRARHKTLDRPIALKVLSDPGSRQLVERFEREARVIAGLRHPHIVAVHDAGRIDGAPYIAMELVEGHTLAEHEVSLRERVAILAKIADGLDYAHRHGIVHRDVKPANVIIDAGGEPRILDFGLAHRLAGTSKLTRTGTALGTPLYMSPEQVRAGRDIGPASDVYSLGVMLYEVIAGETPFFEDDLQALFHRILEDEPARPKQGPPELATVALKAIEKDPARRYPTAAAFAEDLRRWLSGEPVAAKPPSVWTRVGRRVVRRRALVAAAAGVLLAAGVAAVLVPRLRARESEVRQRDEALLVRMRQLTDAYLEAALAERRAGRPQAMLKYVPKAEEACRECERLLPHLSEPHARLGRLYRAVMRPDDAARELDRAIAKNPKDAMARFERGTLRFTAYRERMSLSFQNAWRDTGSRVMEQDQEAAGSPTSSALEARDPEARRLKAGAIEDLEAAGATSVTARAMALTLQDEDQKAAELLRQACAQDPPPDEACLLLAQIELETQRFDPAIAWLSKGVAADLGNLRLLHTRMHAHLSRASFAEKDEEVAAACDAAIEDGEALLRLSEGRQGRDARARARATLGHHQMLRRRDPTQALTDAVALWTEIATKEPSAEAWREIADIHEDLGLWKDDTGDPEEHLQAAIAALDEAAKIEPPDVDAWITRAEIHKHRGRAAAEHGRDIEPCFRAAIECMDRAIDVNPSSDVLWGERADVHLFWAGAEARRGGGEPSRLYQAAHGDLEKALRQNPQSAGMRIRRAHLMMDWMHLAGGDKAALFPAARQDIDEALAKDSKWYGAWTLSAEIRFRWALWKGPSASSQELLEQAIAHLGRAIDMHADRARAWVQRADARGAYVQGGGSRDHLELGLQDANEALRLSPDSPDALRARGVLLFMSGRPAEALPDLEKAVKLEPRLQREMGPLIERCRQP